MPRILWGVVALVLVAVVVIVVVAVSAKSPAQKGGTKMAPDVVAAVTSVPQSTLTSYGVGSSSVVSTPPLPTADVSGSSGTQPPLTAGGKPEVFFFGAEYCPYCAAERWVIVNALSRFGTFSNLGATHSSATDVYPNTPTFDFVGATYTSPYITFESVEYETNTGAPLQKATAAETKLLDKYDTAPYVAGQSGSIPFIDFGNQYIQSGSEYDPQILSGLSYTTIAAEMDNPNTPVGAAIDSAANYLAAAVCQITNDQPASVCSQPYIAKAVAAMAASAKSSSSSAGNATPNVAG